MRAEPILSVVSACLLGCVSSPLVSSDVGPASHGAVGLDAGASLDAWRPTGWPSTYPLRGGPMAPIGPTMLGLEHGVGRVVVSDPDGDLLWLVDVLSQTRLPIELPIGAMPEQIVEDARGDVFVVLRGAGAVATLRLGAETVSIRPVCAAPRGLAMRGDDVLVACAEGVLVTMSPDGATTSVYVDDDLRDVVVVGGHVYVSRFRAAEVLEVEPATGAISQRARPDPVQSPDPLAPTSGAMTRPTVVSTPHVAWRLREENGGLVLVHQLHRDAAVPATGTAGGAVYGGPGETGAIVQSATSSLTLGPARTYAHPEVDTLSGTWWTSTAPFRGQATDYVDGTWIRADGRLAPNSTGDTRAGDAIGLVSPVSEIWLERAPLVIRYGQEPHVRAIVLDPTRQRDHGHDLFHETSPSGVACASCHPEGGDDGHVWQNLPGIAVRTQTTRGDVLATAPFHWEGDVTDFGALMHTTWVTRMGGAPMASPDVDALTTWIGTLTIPTRPSRDASLLARGRDVFERNECGGCHAGERFSSGASANVGTGGPFQIPSLRGVLYRAPYMHSGCARTLSDVFTSAAACSGTRHAIAPGDVTDLVAYLETL